MSERRCGTCQHFTGQLFPKKAGWRNAAGRCGYPVPDITGLPDSLTKGFNGRDFSDLERLKTAVWPDSGESCPCWSALRGDMARQAMAGRGR